VHHAGPGLDRGPQRRDRGRVQQHRRNQESQRDPRIGREQEADVEGHGAERGRQVNRGMFWRR